jgi:hypothetical protein
MADTYLPLLKYIIARLRADAGVGSNIGDRVYNTVPQNENFPYAMVTIDSADFSDKTDSGMSHTVQVDIYDREASTESVASARSAIYDSLHRAGVNIALDTGTLIDIQFNGVADIFKEPDGKTQHAVIQFRAVVQ